VDQILADEPEGGGASTQGLFFASFFAPTKKQAPPGGHGSWQGPQVRHWLSRCHRHRFFLSLPFLSLPFLSLPFLSLPFLSKKHPPAPLPLHLIPSTRMGSLEKI